MDNQNYNQNNVPADGDKSPKYTLWLVLAIVQIVAGCCCSGGIFTLITGVLTIVFANNGNAAYKMGDMETHDSKMKAAMIVNIIGWVISVVMFIIMMLTGAFQGFANAMSSYGY